MSKVRVREQPIWRNGVPDWYEIEEQEPVVRSIEHAQFMATLAQSWLRAAQHEESFAAGQEHQQPGSNVAPAALRKPWPADSPL